MKIEYNIPNYTKAEAYTIVNDFLGNLVEEHKSQLSSPEKVWNNNKDQMDFSFKVIGFKTSGNIKLLEGKIVLDGSIPLLARGFNNTIESAITANLEKAFPKK